jgi:hypothetical protein
MSSNESDTLCVFLNAKVACSLTGVAIDSTLYLSTLPFVVFLSIQSDFVQFCPAYQQLAPVNHCQPKLCYRPSISGDVFLLEVQLRVGSISWSGV